MNHAFIICANNNVEVVKTALRLLDDPRNDIYLLWDKKCRLSQSDIESLRSQIKISKIFIDNSLSIHWGGYSQIDAVLYLMNIIKASGNHYDYIHYLQGADLPIKTIDEIDEFFKKNKGQEYVMIEKDRTSMAVNKTHYRHFFCNNRFFRKNKLVKGLNFSLVWIQKLLHVEYNKDIAVYQGSALFSISNDCANYILGRENEIRKRFRFSLAPDEVFMQTILMDSPYRDKIADIDNIKTFNARLIDRTRPDGKNSPHIWRMDEMDVLLSQPEGVCFARKFIESVDFEIVQQLEDKLSSQKK